MGGGEGRGGVGEWRWLAGCASVPSWALTCSWDRRRKSEQSRSSSSSTVRHGRTRRRVRREGRRRGGGRGLSLAVWRGEEEEEEDTRFSSLHPVLASQTRPARRDEIRLHRGPGSRQCSAGNWGRKCLIVFPQNVIIFVSLFSWWSGLSWGLTGQQLSQPFTSSNQKSARMGLRCQLPGCAAWLCCCCCCGLFLYKCTNWFPND